MMGSKRVVWFLAVLVLVCAVSATQMESCDPMDGTHHALTSCPAAVLPMPLVLALVLLSFVPLTSLFVRPQFVLVTIDRPPRRLRAR